MEVAVETSKNSTGQICSFGTGPKSFLEAPTAFLKTLGGKERVTQAFLFSYTIFMYICYVKKVFSIRIMNI